MAELIENFTDSSYGIVHRAFYSEYQEPYYFSLTGQTFTPPIRHTITSVKLLIGPNSPGPVGDPIIVTIRGVDQATGKPTDVILGTAAQQLWSGVYGWYEFIFSDAINVLSGMKYAIVIKYYGGQKNYPAQFNPVASYGNAGYAGGRIVEGHEEGATSWAFPSASLDICFKIYGEIFLKKPTDPTPEHVAIDIPEPDIPEPELPIPVDGAVDVPLNLKRVRWKQGGGATSYKLYHNFATGLGVPVYVTTVAATDAVNPMVGTPETYELTFAPGLGLSAETEYTWRVDAYDGLGMVTGDTWTFTTILKPEKPTCVWPPDGLHFAPGSTGLEWEDPGAEAVNKAKGYKLYFGHTSMFLSFIPKNALSPTGATISVPRRGTTATAKEVNDDNYYTAGSNYAWRVDAYNRAGKTTGDVWIFDVVWIGDGGGDEPDRPDNPDDDEGDGYGDGDGDITTAGGGRHGAFLVVIGHKKVYVRRA